MEKYYETIAVDFDGTLCFSNWPELGAPNKALIAYLQEWRKNGNKLILWTCRAGTALSTAVEWCHNHGLEFDAVNDNLPGKTYIHEKLKGAGCNQTIFEEASIEAILNAADGTPRMINKYCNASMLIGDSKKADLITTDITMQAINDCELG